jgi:multicomponent Na+:H+ antiporter subunit D
MKFSEIPPGFLLIFGACLVPFIPGKLKNLFTILLPALAFYLITQLPETASLKVTLFQGFPEMNLLRVDKLSKIFGYIFALNACVGMIFAFYLKDNTHHSMALAYIGSALGVVFAGDLMALYIYWEFMAVFSALLILSKRNRDSYFAAQRYLLVHIVGGLCLLAGILMHYQNTGSLAFASFSYAEFWKDTAIWLILIGILINAAAPPLGSWLPDAYPASSVTAGVILSAYTTKTAVYVLARAFPGWDPLLYVGCAMSIYGIIYALLENDMRRILAYSIINQVGFMVAGIGIGTAMALNGTAAHAFCHIIYKSLLWMSAGAVLYRTGKSKCTDLGGLYRTMPWTMLLGTVGALAISAVPLTSGFTSKTIILTAAEHEHLGWVWLILECASAGVFLHAGIKFPYFVFFAKDRGLRPKEAPASMLIAMGILAFLCIYIGIDPRPLYAILPFEMAHYSAYHPGHVLAQMQLLTFSALVFFLFLPWLKRTPTISLDSDWFYRKGAKAFYILADKSLNGINAFSAKWLLKGATAKICRDATNACATLTLFALKPIWKISGSSHHEIEIQSNDFRESLGKGVMPIGFAAALVIAAMTILTVTVLT